MKADYESAFDTVQITLEDVDRFSACSDVVGGGAVIVSFYDGHPVMVDVIGTRHGFEGPLRIAADRNNMDAEALIAAAKAAIAAPDRPVHLDVGARVAA